MLIEYIDIKNAQFILENIYSCFSNTDIHPYIYIYIYMFCKTYILAFQRFSTAVEIMLWTLKWSWNILHQKPMQAHGPSAECGPNSAPSLHLTLTKPDGFGRILYQWIICFQRNPWLLKWNWNFQDAAFKIRILDFDVIWTGLDSLELYHNSNRVLHKILLVATEPLFLLQRWRLSRTLNFYFCSCSLSSLTKLHVVQLNSSLMELESTRSVTEQGET